MGLEVVLCTFTYHTECAVVGGRSRRKMRETRKRRLVGPVSVFGVTDCVCGSIHPSSQVVSRKLKQHCILVERACVCVFFIHTSNILMHGCVGCTWSALLMKSFVCVNEEGAHGVPCVHSPPHT